MFPKLVEKGPMRAVAAFTESAYFPPVLGAVALLMSLLSLDLAGVVLMLLAGAFVCLFSPTTRPLVPVIFLTQFVLSIKGLSRDLLNYFLSPAVIAVAVAAAAVFVGSAVARLIVMRRSLDRIPPKGLLLGFALYSLVLLLAGAFSKYWTVDSLLLAVSLIASGILLYAFLYATMPRRTDDIRYVARVCAVAELVISAELICLYASHYTPGFVMDSAWKDTIVLGWGTSNLIGTLLVFLMPPLFYLVHSEKHGWLYYLLCIAVIAATYFTLCRNALLIGVPMFAVGTVVVLLRGINRKGVLIIVAVMACLAAAALGYAAYAGKLSRFTEFFSAAAFSDRGRFAIWSERMQKFFEYPVFGVGFASAGKISDGAMRLAHNTAVQILSSCGIVGAVAYLFHRVQTVALFVRRPSVARVSLGLAVLGYLVMGLLDPIVFYANFMIYYTVMLTVAEKDCRAAIAAASPVRRL